MTLTGMTLFLGETFYKTGVCLKPSIHYFMDKVRPFLGALSCALRFIEASL